MVNKFVSIAIAVIIIVGLLGAAALYTEKSESKDKEEIKVIMPEPKKFTVDLNENMGLAAP